MIRASEEEGQTVSQPSSPSFSSEQIQPFDKPTPARDKKPRSLIGWWQSLSVKTKATGIAVALGVLPVLIVGGIATYIANEIIVRETVEERQRLAVNISLQLNGVVRSRIQDTQTIASTPAIVDEEIREIVPVEEIIDYFNSFTQRDSGYEQILTVTPEGGIDTSGENNTPLRTTRTELPAEFLAANARPFTELNAAYQLQTRGNLRPAAILKTALPTSDIPSLYIASPVLNPDSSLRNIVYSQTPLSSLADVVRENLINLIHQGGAGGTRALPAFHVVDHSVTYVEQTAEGQVQEISPTRINATGNTIEIDGQLFQSGGPFATQENRVVVSSDEAAGTELQSIFPRYPELRNRGIATTVTDVSAIDGQEYIISYAPIARIEGLFLDWGVLIYEPTATAFAAQRTLLLTLSIGTIVTALTLGVIAAVLTNRATRPLLAAVKAVDEIGQGELSTRIPVQGQDELGLLGTNINRMASQIQSYLDTQALEAERERLLATAKGSGTLRTSDLASMFEQVVDGTREFLRTDRIMLYFINADRGGTVLLESPELETTHEENKVSEPFLFSESLIQDFEEGQILTIQNWKETDTHFELLTALEQRSIQSSILAPIMSGDRLFGILMVHNAAPYQWNELEIEFLRQLTTELGLSIYRVELLEQTERLAEEQRKLKEGLQLRALELLQEVDPISKGDLTTRAKVTADEIGTIADSYNATVDNLKRIVLQVQNAANQVVETTSTSETAVQALSAEALQQATELAQALNVVQNLTGAVQEVAHNAQQAELAVREAAQTVEEGDLAMNRTVDGIQVIRSTVADTAKKVKHLGESSQKISKVVELISAFTAQTNMLALNASIEASRAGEEGRGFAVVASEVRALARQSAEATEEIRKLIASIQAETSEVVTAMESGIEQVVIGTKLVDDTRQSLNNITAASNRIGNLVSSIAQLTVSQTTASSALTQTMKEVADIANKTSEEARYVALSFEQLRQVAQTLQDGIGQFKV
ncbi:methyl-accepting chemotaxis protein [Egbenema bharatensis]|uniref:methyl-accepting chemotaxis protein n=1 Tax=Egbenema bharatensis TaxID=3463334 RepID=UPI003A8B6749